MKTITNPYTLAVIGVTLELMNVCIPTTSSVDNGYGLEGYGPYKILSYLSESQYVRQNFHDANCTIPNGAAIESDIYPRTMKGYQSTAATGYVSGFGGYGGAIHVLSYFTYADIPSFPMSSAYTTAHMLSDCSDMPFGVTIATLGQCSLDALDSSDKYGPFAHPSNYRTTCTAQSESC